MTPLLDVDLGVLQPLAFVVDDVDREIGLPDRVDPRGGLGAPRIVGGASGVRELPAGSMSSVTPGPKPITWIPPISMVCETPPTPNTKLAWVAA